MSKTSTNQDASNILSNVPSEKAFFFFAAEGVYTKVSAISLQDFAAKLGSIDAGSILFHYPRGDFQAWIKDTVKDNVLASRMCFIEQGISGEKLRQELLNLTTGFSRPFGAVHGYIRVAHRPTRRRLKDGKLRSRITNPQISS